MPEMHSSPFAGFITIEPPLSVAERDYINAFKKTRRVDRVQGPYFVTTTQPLSDVTVLDYDAPPYGQPSLWCQWEITEDGSRIVFDEDEHEFEKPLEWMVYLIDHFLRLKPFVMEEFSQVRNDYRIPNFSGHICNGHIQCRKYHNIVVENNHVGKELSWPNGKVEWLNQPEPVFEAMQDARDKRHHLVQVPKPLVEHQNLEEIQDLYDDGLVRRSSCDFSLDGLVKLFSGGLPLRGHKAGMVDLQRQEFEEMYAKANRIDDWKEDQDVTEITREDVEILKADWEGDPIWDLEDTEGFEAYRDELKAFSDAKKADWVARREQQERDRVSAIHQKAEELGCSFGMAQHIACLEGRIKYLERQVGALIDKSEAARNKLKGF